MKRIVILPGALKFFRRYKSEAPRIMAKIEHYAQDPTSLSNKVKRLQGGEGFRLRVGEFRVIFEETEDEIIVTKIGPRGGVYD